MTRYNNPVPITPLRNVEKALLRLVRALARLRLGERKHPA